MALGVIPDFEFFDTDVLSKQLLMILYLATISKYS